MLKQTLCAIGVLTLSGCGISDYFDQHPANVRAESDDSGTANSPASSGSEIAPMSASAPQAAGAASPAVPDTPPATAEPSPSAAPSQGAVTAEQTNGSEDCNAVAAARAADAAANGYGDDLQQAVHDKTYADCTAWNAAHR